MFPALNLGYEKGTVSTLYGVQVPKAIQREVEMLWNEYNHTTDRLSETQLKLATTQEELACKNAVLNCAKSTLAYWRERHEYEVTLLKKRIDATKEYYSSRLKVFICCTVLIAIACFLL